MRCGQHDPRLAGPSEDVSFRSDSDPPAPSIPPPAGVSIPPATIAEVLDHPPVRPPAALAAASCTPKPDHG